MENEAFVKMDSVNSTPSSTPSVTKKKWSVKVKEAPIELNELIKLSRYKYGENNESLLHLAVQNGSVSLLNKEIEKAKEKDDIDGLDHYGFAPLHHTTRYNRIDAMKILLNNGANADVRTKDDFNTPLHIAARFGWTEATRLLLDNGADPSIQNINGSTPLHLACRRSSSEVVALLLGQPSVDINAKDKLQITPLHLAASQGSIEVCQLLMDQGADVLAVAADSATPLHSAIVNSNTNCSRNCVANAMLSRAVELNHGFDHIVKSRDLDGNTLLHTCTFTNCLAIARRIIELGADVNELNTTLGKTPLHVACAMGSLEMVKMLIEKKAKLQPKDFSGQTPLHKAAMFGHVHIIEYLLNNGAEVDPRDSSHQTPFLVAVASRRTNANTVQLLLKRGAQIDATESHLKNCFHLAIENQNIEILDLLLEYDSALENLYAPDVQERVPLHYAAICEDIKALKALLTKQSRLNFRDEEHNTALYLAAKHNRSEHVEVLGLAGSSVSERGDEGKTALHVATENGNRKVCKTLIKLGADVNSHDDHRQTPLMCAAATGCPKACKTLLDNNAKIDDTNNDGETALLIAIRHNNELVVELLLDLGADVKHRNFAGLGPIYMATKWNALEAVKTICNNRRWREVLEDNPDPTGYHSMKVVIHSFPEAATIIMNKCVKKSNMNPKLPDYTIEYDFTLLDPGPDDPAFLKGNRYFGPLAMVETNRQDLLLHPLTQALLDRKWSSFGSFVFYFSFLIYLGFLISYSYFIITERQETNMTKVFDKNHRENAKISTIYEVMGSRFIIASIILMFVILQILREIVQILLQGRAYFKDIVNLMEWALYTTAAVFLIPYVAPDYVVDAIFWKLNDPYSIWIIGVFSIFLCYTNFVLFLRRFNLFGIYISMFIEVFRSVIKVMFVFLELITAYAIAFFILFKNQPSFSSFQRSFVKTTVMTVGEIDFTSTFVESMKGINDKRTSTNPFPEIAFFFCFLFVFAMSISLMNLLIGIAIGDIEVIRRHAELKRLSRQVEFVAQIEEKYPRFITRMVYKPNLVVKPNKETFRKRLEKFGELFASTLQNFTSLEEAATGEDLTNVNPNGIDTKIEKNRKQIKALVAVIETQNRLLNEMANKLDPNLVPKDFGDNLDLDNAKLEHLVK